MQLSALSSSCVSRRTYVQDGDQTWQEGVFCYEKKSYWPQCQLSDAAVQPSVLAGWPVHGLATFGLSHGFKAEEVLPDWLLHQVLRLETTSPFSSPSTGPSTHLRALITKFKSESLEISAQTTPDSPVGSHIGTFYVRSRAN